MASSSLALLFLLFSVYFFAETTLGCDFATPYRDGIEIQPSSAAEEWNFDRKGAVGPQAWPQLFSTCTGMRQSPINLMNPQSGAALPPLVINYPDTVSAMFYRNEHHLYQVDLPATGPQGLLSGGQLNGTYSLAQFHFHASSEHHVSGNGGIGEIHFVHLSTNPAFQAVDHPQRYAVLGMILQEASAGETFIEDATIQSFYNQLTPLLAQLHSGKKKNITIPDLHLSQAVNSAKKDFYTYLGSLTTPPCSETVVWTVLSNPVHLSSIQAQEFTVSYPGLTNRPTQALSNRNIWLSSSSAPGVVLPDLPASA